MQTVSILPEFAGLIPGLRRSLEKEMATNSSILPRQPHGQRLLVSCGPRDGTEPDVVTAHAQLEHSLLRGSQINTNGGNVFFHCFENMFLFTKSSWVWNTHGLYVSWQCVPFREIFVQEASHELSLSTEVSAAVDCTLGDSWQLQFRVTTLRFFSFFPPLFPFVGYLYQEYPASFTTIITYMFSHSTLYYTWVIGKYKCFDLKAIG